MGVLIVDVGEVICEVIGDTTVLLRYLRLFSLL